MWIIDTFINVINLLVYMVTSSELIDEIKAISLKSRKEFIQLLKNSNVSYTFTSLLILMSSEIIEKSLLNNPLRIEILKTLDEYQHKGFDEMTTSEILNELNENKKIKISRPALLNNLKQLGEYECVYSDIRNTKIGKEMIFMISSLGTFIVSPPSKEDSLDSDALEN